jgi:GntR family transcriptional regulator, arabinose operon transcriptional repressor
MNKVTDISVLQDSFVSLHVQLHNQLRHLILSGRWPNGSRIPSESTLATSLNISRSTVRLALQHAEIEGLIERFSGRGSFVAHSAKAGPQRRLIAFVTHRFDSDTLLLILKGAEAEARVRGYQIILNTVQNQQEEIAVLRRLKSENVVGILIWPDAAASRALSQNPLNYGAAELPMVAIDRQIYGIDCDFVTSDHYTGTEALMQHLVDLGHRHIAFLLHQQSHLFSVRERYRAYTDVLKRYGLIPTAPWVVGEPNSEVGATDALRSSVGVKSAVLEQIQRYLRTADPRPTAIVSLHDYLAIMAVQAMKMSNMLVPDVISITGFDDIELASYLEVPLTTVAQDHFSLGKQAARLLFDRIEGFAGPSVREVLPTELRIRHSTAVAVSLEGGDAYRKEPVR